MSSAICNLQMPVLKLTQNSTEVNKSVTLISFMINSSSLAAMVPEDLLTGPAASARHWFHMPRVNITSHKSQDYD